MSFISKLLGKTEREEPVAPDEEAPALAPASEGSPAGDAPANTSESQITPAPTADSTSASQGGEWWESSSDLTAETIQANELAEPIPASIAAPESAAPAVDSKPEGYGTRPLDEHHAALRPTDADTPEPDDDSGTRPLTSADLPALVALHSRRGLAFAALRDVGRVRSINQDSIFALLTTLPREGNDLPLGLFIVADGMGGHQGGEVASRLAISTVAQHVMAELIVPALTDDSTEALQPLIIAAVQEANRVIWEQAQTVGSDMGTTCTVALLLGHALYLGHVGDFARLPGDQHRPAPADQRPLDGWPPHPGRPARPHGSARTSAPLTAIPHRRPAARSSGRFQLCTARRCHSLAACQRRAMGYDRR